MAKRRRLCRTLKLLVWGAGGTGMKPTPRNGRLTFGAACVAVLLAVVLAYANHFHNGFHFDDWHTVVENPAIRSLANVPRFFRDGLTFSVIPGNASYRPLVST